MKIFLTDQKDNLGKHLDLLKEGKVMVYDLTRLKETTTTIELDTIKSLGDLDLQFLFDYKIFPDNIMTFLSEWIDENRGMKVGDTIVQQVYLPPLKTFSQKIIFGVRISEIIDTMHRKGFSYETLEGHVEKGISTFTVEQSGSETIFRIHTFSTPGNALTKLLGPVFSIPYQRFCTRAALENVKRQVEKE